MCSNGGAHCHSSAVWSEGGRGREGAPGSGSRSLNSRGYGLQRVRAERRGP